MSSRKTRPGFSLDGESVETRAVQLACGSHGEADSMATPQYRIKTKDESINVVAAVAIGELVRGVVH